MSIAHNKRLLTEKVHRSAGRNFLYELTTTVRKSTFKAQVEPESHNGVNYASYTFIQYYQACQSHKLLPINHEQYFFPALNFSRLQMTTKVFNVCILQTAERLLHTCTYIYVTVTINLKWWTCKNAHSSTNTWQ